MYNKSKNVEELVFRLNFIIAHSQKLSQVIKLADKLSYKLGMVCVSYLQNVDMKQEILLK